MSNSAIRLLERAARLWPERVYVEEEGGSATYAALLARARTIGAALLGDRRPVVVYLPKSIDALAVFFGALCAGRPYAPVDAHIPVARLEKIAASLEPAYIVTNEALLPNLEGADLGAAKPVLLSQLEGAAPDDAGVDAAIGAVIDTDPIYVMYTSGSTGAPKGVTIPHRGILDYADWVADTFAFDESTVMANQAPFYFDNSTFDIYGTLRCGGRLLLTPETLFLFPLKLPEYLEAHGATSIFWVPTVMINVANSGALEGRALPRLKNVAFCGEVMPNTQLNIWRRALPDCRYANLYGPTEITDVCCYYQVDRPFDDHEPLPIGKACENMRVRILTDEGREAATGDLARRGEDGLIYFLGRKDSQIKLKGNRIELGEIEAAAMCVPGVANACALFDAPRERIVLFVEGGGGLNLRKMNLELKKYIPQYMLPGKLVAMDRLPHTANDKIDRVTLRATLKEEEPC